MSEEKESKKIKAPKYEPAYEDTKSDIGSLLDKIKKERGL